MPVQTWTPGQILTAAELSTVSNMLPYPAVTGSSVNPCAAGTLYRCQPSGSITMTLPPPTAGATIGFILDATSGTATITASGGAQIYGPGLVTGGVRGVTSYAIVLPDALCVVMGDGANWHVTARQEGFQSSRANLGVIGPVLNTSGIQEIHTSLRVTLIVPASGRVLVQQNAMIAIITGDFDDIFLYVQPDSSGWTETGGYGFGANAPSATDSGSDVARVNNAAPGFNAVANAFRSVSGSVWITGLSAGTHVFQMGWARAGGGQTFWIPGDLRAAAQKGTWNQVATF